MTRQWLGCALTAAVVVAFILCLEIFGHPDIVGAFSPLHASAVICAAVVLLGIALYSNLCALRHRCKQQMSLALEGSQELKRCSQALLHIATSKFVFSGNVKAALEELARVAAETLEVDRVSVWQFTRGNEYLECLDLYERASGRHSAGEAVPVSLAPECYTALQTNRVIAVDNVVKDLAGTGLGSILAERGIKSLLEGAIYVNGCLHGMVSMAQTTRHRPWNTHEKIFGGSLADMAAMVFQVAQRIEAENKLAENERFLRTVIDTDPNFIFVKDRQSRFRLVNRAVAEAYGTTVENLVGRSDADYNRNTDEVTHFRSDDDFVIRTGERLLIPEEQITDAQGKLRWLQTVKLPLHVPGSSEIHLLGVSTDITERRALQEQLTQSQKLDALGKLAGGIAHDFNNMMTGILGYTTLLKMSCRDDENVVRNAEMIEKAATRAAELTHKLLGFARKGKHQHVRVDLHATITDTVDIVSRTIEPNIALHLNLSAANPHVMGDPTQLQQVILNLLINARDAMCVDLGGTPGGALTIETRLAPGNSPVGSDASLTALDNCLEIVVRDTGCGIAAEHLDKIFEPFYSTKPSNAGTGMGLAMVYGIVKNHCGSIQVQSEIGQGAEFIVRLPSAAPPISVAVERSGDTPHPGHGMILVVDDHDVVRNVTCEMLTVLGYSVRSASDGVEAVEMMKQNPQSFDVALVDLMMPRMNARECVQSMREIRPGMRIILTTGYGHSHLTQEIIEQGVEGFMQKPYKLGTLSQVIANALSH